MTINGKPIAIEKVDETTVQFVVAGRRTTRCRPCWPRCWGIGHHARFGRDALGGFAPAHYLKQFHPKYAAKAEARQEGRRGQRSTTG